MRFLVDSCVAPTVLRTLAEAGHDVARAADPDPGDEANLDRAVREDRTVVTHDKDFGALVFAWAAAHRGVLRVGDVPLGEQPRRVLEAVTAHGAELEAGAFVVIEADRVRVRR